MVAAFNDLKARRGHLKEVSAAVGIENLVSTPEKLSERLAVVAVADQPKARSARDSSCDSAKAATATSDG